MKRRSRETIVGLCEKAQAEIKTGKPVLATLDRLKLSSDLYYKWRKSAKLAKAKAPKYARLTAEPSPVSQPSRRPSHSRAVSWS